ncbi:hypothetical protein V6N11_042648 [Hibiscus sabdariffa]|uniref:Small ribosomal subunit protein uS10 domain-containing protein n=1 Tax=Hibiscus sabdariffa TaxID=183260 RepID=A0ABR2QWX2_9ROSI
MAIPSISSTPIPSLPIQNASSPKVEGSKVPSSSYVSEADKAAPMQKIGIKLRSYRVPLIEDSYKQIMDAARTTDAKTTGPVPVPTKKRIYCVLKSPRVHKDARSVPL